LATQMFDCAKFVIVVLVSCSAFSLHLAPVE
jgi:hypothetical protein